MRTRRPASTPLPDRSVPLARRDRAARAVGPRALAARLIALGGPEDLHAALPERADVGARGGIGHMMWFMAGATAIAPRSQTQRREQVVSPVPVRRRAEKIALAAQSARRRPAREFDVPCQPRRPHPTGRLRTCVPRPPGRWSAVTTRRARGHHDLHFRAASRKRRTRSGLL